MLVDRGLLNEVAGERDSLINDTSNEELQESETEKSYNIYRSSGSDITIRANQRFLNKLFSYLTSQQTQLNESERVKVPKSKQPNGYSHIIHQISNDPVEAVRSSEDAVNLHYSSKNESHTNIEDEENYPHRYPNSWYRRRKSRLLKTIILVSIVIAVSIVIISKSIFLLDRLKRYSMSDRSNDSVSSLQDYYKIDLKELESGSDSRWLVSNSKCRIPKMDAWHQSIRKFVHVKKKMSCVDKPLVFTNAITHLSVENFGSFVEDNRLYLTQETIEAGTLIRGDCCYKEITRSDDDSDNDLVYSENCTLIIANGLEAPAKVIRVHCPVYNYTNTHSFMLISDEEEEALERVSKKKLHTDRYHNVILLGVDTVSRLNGIRQLNKTLNVLRDTYKTIEFLGYNKVGDNTFPNLIPLLTGMRPGQLVETKCWLASNFSEEGERGDDYLDNCKYLWNFYQDLGYITYFNEDWPFASTFNYLKPGFHQEPTNFYGRPYALARNEILGSAQSSECSTCFLGRSMAELDLENLKTFIKEYSSKPYFAFHWINCPQHSDLNGASSIDEILMNFFQDIHEFTKERTVVMFFSDHGYRWNDFVSTRIGHYENSLPMLTLAMPELFKEKHPDLFRNLESHRSSLITPFDMFKTLISIRNLGARIVPQEDNARPKNENENENKFNITTKATSDLLIANNSLPPHSTDMFAFTSLPTAVTTVQQLEPINGLNYKQKFTTISLLDKHSSRELERSCVEAGVPDNYCVCHEFKAINPNTLDALGAAYYYVYVHLYTSIKKHKDICYQLDLSKLIDVEIFDFEETKKIKDSQAKQQKAHASANVGKSSRRRMTTAKPTVTDDDEVVIDESHYLPNREYNIRLTTLPGDALFQEVIRFYGSDLEECASSVKEARKIIDSSSSHHLDKHSSIMLMNNVCKFSINSETISRLNLYNNQSRCVKNNQELKKICYCFEQ